MMEIPQDGVQTLHYGDRSFVITQDYMNHLGEIGFNLARPLQLCSEVARSRDINVELGLDIEDGVPQMARGNLDYFEITVVTSPSASFGFAVIADSIRYVPTPSTLLRRIGRDDDEVGALVTGMTTQWTPKRVSFYWPPQALVNGVNLLPCVCQFDYVPSQ